MTTLEALIENRLSEYRERAATLPDIEKRLIENPGDPELLKAKEDALKAREEETAYLLEAFPYIRLLDDDQPPTTTTLPSSPTPQKAPLPRKGINSLITERQVSRKSEAFLEYMERVEGRIIDHRTPVTSRTRCDDDEYVCVCGADMRVHNSTSSLVCTACGITKAYFEGSTRNLTYNEEVSTGMTQNFTYNRLNHLVEWLNSIQARENTEIPDEVIERLRSEFRKQGMVTRGDIKPTKVRSYLKKLNLSKYYEHTYYITGLLNGVPAPKFSRELETKFKDMFVAIQEPFSRHCPPTRKNFLSYSYVLYKFCELLGKDEYLRHFKLLKSRTKLHQQDTIWRKICEDLGWEFHASC